MEGLLSTGPTPSSSSFIWFFLVWFLSISKRSTPYLEVNKEYYTLRINFTFIWILIKGLLFGVFSTFWSSHQETKKYYSFKLILVFIHFLGSLSDLYCPDKAKFVDLKYEISSQAPNNRPSQNSRPPLIFSQAWPFIPSHKCGGKWSNTCMIVI